MHSLSLVKISRLGCEERSCRPADTISCTTKLTVAGILYDLQLLRWYWHINGRPLFCNHSHSPISQNAGASRRPDHAAGSRQCVVALCAQLVHATLLIAMPSVDPLKPERCGPRCMNAGINENETENDGRASLTLNGSATSIVVRLGTPLGRE